jgi:hypothetical protein
MMREGIKETCRDRGGCCFSVKQVELYVIKKTVGTEHERCRDEEHKLDREEMVKTTDCTRT